MLGFCAFSSFCFSALKIRYALRARFGCGRAPPDPSTAGVAWLESITGWTAFFFAGVAFGAGTGLRFRGVPPSASARPGTAAGTSVASSSEEPLHGRAAAAAAASRCSRFRSFTAAPSRPARCRTWGGGMVPEGFAPGPGATGGCWGGGEGPGVERATCDRVVATRSEARGSSSRQPPLES